MSDILAFPPRNKGRFRQSRSPEAMGRCSISLLEREGESVPANVADLREAKAIEPIEDARLALRLALVSFAVLSADQKTSVRKAIRMLARHDDGCAGDDCRALYPLLTGEQLPC